LLFDGAYTCAACGRPLDDPDLPLNRQAAAFFAAKENEYLEHSSTDEAMLRMLVDLMRKEDGPRWGLELESPFRKATLTSMVVGTGHVDKKQTFVFHAGCYARGKEELLGVLRVYKAQLAAMHIYGGIVWVDWDPSDSAKPTGIQDVSFLPPWGCASALAFVVLMPIGVAVLALAVALVNLRNLPSIR